MSTAAFLSEDPLQPASGSEFNSLGIITDDRDYSEWSDDEDDELTPRLLSPLEEDGPEDALAFSKRSTIVPSRSGCWSSFSWTSLYDRGTDSSLSWADEELERETTEKVQSLFDQINSVLFHDQVPPKVKRSKSLPADLEWECTLWRQTYPHIRLTGQSILPPQDSEQVPNVPIRDSPLTESCWPNCDGEVFASHGSYVDEDKSENYVMEGLTINERFECDPEEYFQEKIMTAVFRKVWTQLSEEYEDLVSLFGDRVIQDSLEMLSLSSREGSAIQHRPLVPGNFFEPNSRRSDGYGQKIASIEEESELLGNMEPYFGMGGRGGFYTGFDEDPMSLPNLAQITGSAPPSRLHEESLSRPSSSQTPRQMPARPRRANSFRAERPRTIQEVPDVPGTIVKRGETDKQPMVFRRMRSQSGSPPAQNRKSLPSIQEPLSLPPIRGISAGIGFARSTTAGSVRSPLQTPRAASVMSVGLSRGARASSSTALRDRMNLEPSAGPTLGMERAMSVTGRRLKSLNVDEKRAPSRQSLHLNGKVSNPKPLPRPPQRLRQL